MANAEGGYIFIGVQEKNKIAQGFFTVDNPDKIVESINSVCLESIEPRIQNLEVQTRSLKWNGWNITLVIIHIPPSDLRPHSFVWKNFTHFVKRYGNHIREYNGPQYSGQELSKKFGLTHPYKWRIENVNQTDSSYSEIQVYYCR